MHKFTVIWDRMLQILRRHWLIFVLLLTGTIITMGPAITHCTTTVLGGVGDGTSGFIWHTWLSQQLHTGPWITHSIFTNAPYGERVFLLPYVTTQAVFLPEWAFSKIVGPFCGWNMMVVLGFMLSGLSGYGLTYWLLRHRGTAIFAGLAIAFVPFHIYKAGGHLPYLNSWPLLLMLWAGLYFWKQPSLQKGVLLGLATGLTFYTDGYYLLIGGVLFATMGAAGSIRGIAHIAQQKTTKLRALQSFMMSQLGWIVTLAVLLIPLAITQVAGHNTTDSTLKASRGEIQQEAQVYGARIQEYLLPAATNPLFGYKRVNWERANDHGSNYSESTVYLGYVVLLLGIIGFIVGCSTRRFRFAALTLAGVAIVGFIFSLPPGYAFHGIPFPTPSGLIILITPLWRVFSRFFLIIQPAAVVLAAVGLWYIVRGRSRLVSILICTGFIAILGAEYLTMPPRTTWSIKQAPAIYTWLKQQTGIDTIVEYPLVEPPAANAFDIVTYQQIHGKKIVNSIDSNNNQKALHQAIYGLDDPQTAGVLRALGADFVDLRNGARPTSSSYSLVYSDDTNTGYRITNPTSAQYALAPKNGVTTSRLLPRTQVSSRDMGPAADFEIIHLPGARAQSAVASFTVTPLTDANVPLEISQDNVILWSAIVSTPTIVTIVVNTKDIIQLNTHTSQKEPFQITQLNMRTEN